MINLTIKAFDGQSYELTGRSGKPKSSAAQLYRNDPYLTQRFVARLPLEPRVWLQILQRSGHSPIAYSSSHPAEIHQAVAKSIMRGDLKLYKLPRLDAVRSIRGKQDMGLCIIQGPQPHSASNQSPVALNSPQAARELLNELGIAPQTLLAYLEHQKLYTSDSKGSSLDKVLNQLATGELLAYKIPMPPMAPPPKKLEMVEATGPAYEPVPFGPEPSPQAKQVTPQNPEKKAPPQSIDEAEQRLIDAGPAVRAAKAKGEPLPASPYSLEDKQAVVENGIEDKFLIRVIETKYAGDEGYIGKIRDEGHSISWTAPFSMVEHGDTDAEALLKAFGTRHNPESEYTILIIDKDKMNEVGDLQTIIPTKKNLKSLIASNPEISSLTPNDVERVLSKKLADDYYKFAKEASNQKAKSPREKRAVAKVMGFSDQECDDLMKRQALADQVAAWEEFTGNGMTLDTTQKSPAYGPVEVIMLDKKPMKLGDLKKIGAIKSITC